MATPKFKPGDRVKAVDWPGVTLEDGAPDFLQGVTLIVTGPYDINGVLQQRLVTEPAWSVDVEGDEISGGYWFRESALELIDPPAEFKVGDRVRSTLPEDQGATGSVEHIDRYVYGVRVRFENHATLRSGHYEPHELELIADEGAGLVVLDEDDELERDLARRVLAYREAKAAFDVAYTGLAVSQDSLQ